MAHVDIGIEGLVGKGVVVYSGLKDLTLALFFALHSFAQLVE